MTKEQEATKSRKTKEDTRPNESSPTAGRAITLDGNEAAASVAYRTNEVIAIYPITPASPMGELSDAWAAEGRPNIWGDVPKVVEMQSEGGAAGAIHGALQAGSLSTTFTASQGLLLMLPNMYKIAGELTPSVIHVSARTLATHALSIFGDHSDVMSARQTGYAMLASGSVQEVHDLAAVSHAATLESRIPFLHFFDGFRTSHEISKIEALSDENLQTMLSRDAVLAHRERCLTPDRPVLRGTAQNPDTFFQAREASERFYRACPEVVSEKMDLLARLTGRRYHLFDYHGHPEAERVIVLMGSGAETVHETVDALIAGGEKVGVLKVRLFRPFSTASFVAALPGSTRSVAVLDRTKEPGATGDPLYLDVLTALEEEGRQGVHVVGGRYGLSSKEFDPACVRAVFRELSAEQPRRHFTVGIVDDVLRTSLEIERDPADDKLAPERYGAVFFGLGSDGTVSANKNTIKIIGEATEHDAQGYFVYDSKKAGAVTVSHLRFGPGPIRSTYLIRQADFVGCHQFQFIDRLDMLDLAAPGAKFLLNSPFGPDEVWEQLPREVQDALIEKDLQLHVIDAYKVAGDAGVGRRINTVMQTCFFSLAGILPQDEAVRLIKQAIEKTYGKRGPLLVERNFKAVDETLAHLARVDIPKQASSDRHRPPLVSVEAPEFVQKVSAVMLGGKGDYLPVSAFPVDGTWPTGTSQWEKRAIANEVPLWENELCIQCNQCVMVCPHAAIRAKAYEADALGQLDPPAPEDFLSVDYKGPDLKGLRYSLQVAPEDCTGCRLCVEVCPAKDKANPRRKAINMAPLAPIREREKKRYDAFLALPEIDPERLRRLDTKGTQFLQPLFEYSGACAGCGETPYVKLMTQLFGDRLLIANATGCSSIYGGNLPTTPYTTNDDGRGPAWSNSLFEDNAEFGLGFRLAIDQQQRQAGQLLRQLAPELTNGGGELATAILEADQSGFKEIEEQRERVEDLRRRLATIEGEPARQLSALADYLVEKSVWLLGGDGWAYDIGYGGLDHVLSMRHNVNVLVLDTEVYSNTGGQQSKATPLGAAAKFAASGKETPKKDLGLEAMSYGHVYVAQVAFGAKMNQTVEAFREAEAYDGPSLIIAYSPCIAHGYDLAFNVEQQKKLVASGAWPLYRYDPRRGAAGEPPLKLDSPAPRGKVADFTRGETRFRMVEKLDRQRYKQLMAEAQTAAQNKYAVYSQLAGITTTATNDD